MKPEQQIVTAFPDVTEESLQNIDMIILACDGVWDCKTNQEAVDFCSSKLKKGNKDGVKLSTILGNLMDECLATDIMNGKILNLETGLGCDNMTAVLVQLDKKFVCPQYSCKQLAKGKSRLNRNRKAQFEKSRSHQPVKFLLNRFGL